MKKNYYEMLNVNPNTQSEEIKKAAYHQLNEITQAFKILSDDDKRQAYDLSWQTTPSPITNYYDLLGVDPTTSPTIIEQAALAQLDEIKVALGVLSNTKKRQAYDLTLQSTLPPEERSPYQPPATLINDIRDDPDIRKTDSQKFELASRTRRLSAVITDVIIMILPVVFISLTSFFVHGEEAAGIAMIFAFIGIYLWLPAVTIINLVLLYFYGQTIGKRLLSIKIARSDGSCASLKRIILLRLLPLSLLSWLLGILEIDAINILTNILILIDSLFIFRKDRRCLHDLIADTIVIAQTRVDHKQVSST
jgi:uncharacterized RDD family membrane protein YckC/predicted CoA-binding protein